MGQRLVALQHRAHRTKCHPSRLATGHESSSINRAVAFYHALVGIPTDGPMKARDGLDGRVHLDRGTSTGAVGGCRRSTSTAFN
jgi:hypothetical protein